MSRVRAAAAAMTTAATVLAALVAGPGAAAESLGATTWMSRSWGVDGRVSELVPTPRGVVVGGSFGTALGPAGQSRPARGVALWDPDTGAFVDWPVQVAGEVLAAAVDGDTVYLGGDFSAVNGSARRNLAAVSLRTGALQAWDPRAFGAVETIAVRASSVYVGGAFDQIQDGIGTTAVARVARIGGDGVLDRTWSASIAADERVRVILPAAHTSGVYVGGDFTSLFGTSALGRLALVGTGATAVPDPTFRSGSNNGRNRSPVFDIDLAGGGSLVIASGGGGGGCTRQDAVTGRTVWSYRGTGDIVAARVLGPNAYCAGHFNGTASLGGLDRNKIAEIDLASGAIGAFAPRVNSALGIWALASTPTTLVAGGDFTTVSQNLQPHLGAFRDRSALAPPGAPVGVSAVPGDRSVTLQWGHPDTDGGAKVGRYIVLRENDSGVLVQVGNTAGTTFTDTGLTDGVEYRYAVRASTSVGEGPASAPVAATPDGDATFAPTVPRDFAVTGGTSARMTWSAPASDGGSAVTGYRVYRSVAGGGESLLSEVGAGARTAEDRTCPVQQSCAYRVAAVNAVGEGPRTAAISVVGNTGVPATPVLTASAGPGAAASLSWTLSSPGAAPVTRFVVLRDGVRRATTGADVLSFVDTGLVSGRSYVYQVRAVNSFGNSENSDPRTV
ncbi:MAG: fibronectin type III domain-containing protein, partial [Dermatophilaceae bacterium]